MTAMGSREDTTAGGSTRPLRSILRNRHCKTPVHPEALVSMAKERQAFSSDDGLNSLQREQAKKRLPRSRSYLSTLSKEEKKVEVQAKQGLSRSSSYPAGLSDAGEDEKEKTPALKGVGAYCVQTDKELIFVIDCDDCDAQIRFIRSSGK